MTHLLSRMACAAVLAVASTCAWAQPAELEGVKLEPAMQVASAPLVLNGAGLRTRAFFKVYVAALYVPKKSADAATLLAQTGPRRVAITMLRDVDAATFAGALNDGLKDNHTEAQLAALKPQIDQLNAAFKQVGEAKKGDLIQLDFAPDVGTRVVVNGQPRGSAMAGDAFFSALLRIWLGDKPADGGLKKGLLGG
ncbi:MAG: chalcone isomerase family protein [Burkholderiales bacterium]|nr:chalcone isomerase family protein [Burkholderiales bacterium]